MADKNKLLGQLLLKGLKGNFEPIMKWLQFVEINSEQLINLSKTEDGNIEIVFDTLRPGLLSRDNETAVRTFRVILKLTEEMAELDLQPLIWNWFCRESGGLSSCILGLKKHENVYDYVGAILSVLAANNVSELLTVELKKTVAEPLDFINLTHEFLDVFASNGSLALQVDLIQPFSKG